MEREHQSILQTFWDGRTEREKNREEMDPRKKVHTDLLWREIRRCIGGQESLAILDAGAGTGRFSIPLAKEGHRLVHFDISPGMLGLARAEAAKQHLESIEFVEGTVGGLSGFEDEQFDLVLCLDSPLSFCYDCYEEALRELVRVTNSGLVLCVMDRCGVTTEGIAFDLSNFGELRTVPVVYETGTLHVTEELRRYAPGLMPSWHAFTPSEMQQLLAESGYRPLRMSAPGTFARFAEPDHLKALFDRKDAYERYLDFEERYDSNPDVLGLGGGSGGGLLVSAEKRADQQA